LIFIKKIFLHVGSVWPVWCCKHRRVLSW